MESYVFSISFRHCCCFGVAPVAIKSYAQVMLASTWTVIFIGLSRRLGWICSFAIGQAINPWMRLWWTFLINTDRVWEGWWSQFQEYVLPSTLYISIAIEIHGREKTSRFGVPASFSHKPLDWCSRIHNGICKNSVYSRDYHYIRCDEKREQAQDM